MTVPLSAVESAPQQNVVADENAGTASVASSIRNSERSYLTNLWNLDDQSNRDPSQLGRLQPYRQTYMIAKRTSKPNVQPDSPAIGRSTTAPKDFDLAEAKFQFSFKSDIGNQRNINLLGIKTARLWVAYSQQSNWQAFNIRNSSPFRETIYEPELIATLGTGDVSGLKLINLGWVHQSNGRSLPESRGWYRAYLLTGWEWNDMTSILIRGWKRVMENSVRDDNPDIIDYQGRGDLVIRWEPRNKTQAIAVLLRNNLKRTNNRGYMQIDWATPVQFGSAARIHLQLTSGYGESLIDYNHRQNTIGLGFSFREW
jgi:phospholipase A1